MNRIGTKNMHTGIARIAIKTMATKIIPVLRIANVFVLFVFIVPVK